MKVSQISLLLVVIAFLVSCSGPSAQPAHPSPQSTAGVEPRYSAIEKTNEPVSDGVLSLLVDQQAGQRCSRVGNPISLKLTFENLSDKSLVIQSRFELSHKRLGPDEDIFVWLDAEDGTPLLAPGDTVFDETWGKTPAPPRYRTLRGHSKLEITLAYTFPTQLINESVPNGYKAFTPSPGKYLIRAIYQNLVASQPHEWTGVIASNRMEICVIE